MFVHDSRTAPAIPRRVNSAPPPPPAERERAIMLLHNELMARGQTPNWHDTVAGEMHHPLWRAVVTGAYGLWRAPPRSTHAFFPAQSTALSSATASA